MHSEKFKLDFRTKMLMSLCLSYTLILGNIQTKFSIVAAAYSLLPYVFLLLNREKKAAVKGILFIMAAYIIQKEWVFSAGGFLGSLFLFITMMFLRLLPGFVMARFALASSTMSHMTSALKKMHFPVVLIIPITVMARDQRCTERRKRTGEYGSHSEESGKPAGWNDRRNIRDRSDGRISGRNKRRYDSAGSGDG